MRNSAGVPFPVDSRPTFLHFDGVVDFKARIEELKAKAPRPQYRAAHGQWVEPGWMVRALVEDGRPVLTSVKFVVEELKLQPTELAIKSVRQAYYALRKLDWPEDMRPTSQAPATPEPTPAAATVAKPKAKKTAKAQPAPTPAPPLPPQTQPTQKVVQPEDEWEWDATEKGNPPPQQRQVVNPQYHIDPNFKI